MKCAIALLLSIVSWGLQAAYHPPEVHSLTNSPVINKSDLDGASQTAEVRTHINGRYPYKHYTKKKQHYYKRHHYYNRTYHPHRTRHYNKHYSPPKKRYYNHYRYPYGYKKHSYKKHYYKKYYKKRYYKRRY